MSDVEALATPGGLSLREAISWRRRHSAAPGRARMAAAIIALVVLVPIHVMVFVMADNTWSLLAVVANPLAIYCAVRGWAYVDLLWMGLAIVCAIVGSFLPFYLV